MELKYVNFKSNSRGFLLLLLTIFSCQVIFSQTVISKVIPTGYLGNQSSNFKFALRAGINEYDRASLFLAFESSDSSNLITAYNFYRIDKSTLVTLDSNMIWQRGSKFVPLNLSGTEGGIESKLLEDPSNGNQYISEFEYDANTSDYTINIYSVRNLIEKDSIILTSTINGKRPSSQVFIYQSRVFFISIVNQSFYSIYSIDLNSGQILKKRDVDFNNYQLGQDFNTHKVYRISEHFEHDSLLVFYEGDANFISMLDIDSLETKARIGFTSPIQVQLYNSSNYFNSKTSDYHIDSSGVYMGGYSTHFTLPNTYDDQFFSSKFNWDSTLSYYRNFGDTNTHEWGMSYKRHDSSDYIFGSAPIVKPYYAFAPNRTKLLLLRYNGQQLDSIQFEGTKNHSGFNMVVDNSHIFTLSTFSNAWTNDSIYLQINKIPIGLLTGIEELPQKKGSRKIIVYPNPSREMIKSELFKIGDEYSIYDLKGSLVFSGTINQKRQVEVRHLQNGTYYLRLNKEGSFGTAIFMKVD